MAVTLEHQLRLGINALGLDVPPATQQYLLKYLELLAKWNKAFNLTAVRKPEDMVTRHLLDSLSVAPYITGRNILDVGTGPGLPGIPLSFLMPEKHFVLLDSNSKKTRFLSQLQIEMKLSNITIVNQRVENFRPDMHFDIIITRAFASLRDMLVMTGHLVSPTTRVLAMKARLDEDLSSLPPEYEVKGIHPLHIPALDARRQLVEVVCRG